MPLQQISVSPLDWGKENPNSGNQTQDWKNLQEPVFTASAQNPLERCASQASSLSNNHDICRICHCEGDNEVPLIAPCYCAGSLRYVHQACLQQWIKSSDIRSCELCKFQFIMQSKIKPFGQWESLEMSGVERRKLLCSVTFHAVALTCVVWSLYVLIDRTAEEIQRGLLEWPFWTKLIVVAIGFTGGLVFMYIQCKAYLHLCRRWRAFNRVIYVQNAPEKAALPPARPLTREESVLVSETCCGAVTVDGSKRREGDLVGATARKMELGDKPATGVDTFQAGKGDGLRRDLLQNVVTIDISKNYQTIVPKSVDSGACTETTIDSKNCGDPLDVGSGDRKLSFEGECEELSRLLSGDGSRSPAAASSSGSEEAFPSPAARLLQARPWTDPGMGSQSPLLARAVLKEGPANTN